MSQLETHVKSALGGLFADRKISTLISIPEMTCLAAWAFKLATVVEVMDADVAVTTADDRRWLMARKEPPPGTQVWLGKYGGEEWKLRWKRCAFGLYAAVDQNAQFSKAPPNAFTVTFVAGSVVLLVFFRATELMPPFEFRAVPESLLQIWPSPKSPRFAPSNEFNNADMAVLSDAIFAQAGELANREIDADFPLRPRTPRKKS